MSTDNVFEGGRDGRVSEHDLLGGDSSPPASAVQTPPSRIASESSFPCDNGYERRQVGMPGEDGKSNRQNLDRTKSKQLEPAENELANKPTYVAAARNTFTAPVYLRVRQLVHVEGERYEGLHALLHLLVVAVRQRYPDELPQRAHDLPVLTGNSWRREHKRGPAEPRGGGGTNQR